MEGEANDFTLTRRDAESQHEYFTRQIVELQAVVAAKDAEIERLKGLLVDATMEVGKGEMHMDTLEREHRDMATAISDLCTQLAARDALLAAATPIVTSLKQIAEEYEASHRSNAKNADLPSDRHFHEHEADVISAVVFDAANWLPQETKGEGA